MENKETADSTSSRWLRLPVHPYACTTTVVPQARNSHHQRYSRRLPFQREQAAAAAHFSSQTGRVYNAYQMPPSPLSRATHALAGGAGTSAGGSTSRDNVPGSGCELPPLPPYLGGQPLPQTATVEDLGAVDWSSWGTSQLSNTIASSSGSSTWMPQPYSAGNTLPAPAANVELKGKAVAWASQTLQLGKNTFTSGGSSSSCMHEPAYSSMSVVGGSNQNLVSHPGTVRGSAAPGSSIQYKDDANAPFDPTYADGLFTQNDIDKIKKDKDLNDIVDTDPKKVRSVLSRRRSSQRATEKKAARLSDLERKVEQLQQEKKILSELVNSEQSTTLSRTAEKNELIIKLLGCEQKIQLMDAVNETLYAEVCRLKLAAGEMWGSRVPNSSYQEMDPQTMQQENVQIQDHELAQFMHELEPLVDLDNFLA